MPSISITVDRGGSRNVQISDIFINTVVVGELPTGIINETRPKLRVTAPLTTGNAVLNYAQQTTVKALNFLVSNLGNRASIEFSGVEATSSYTVVTLGAVTSPATVTVNGVQYTYTWDGSTLTNKVDALEKALTQAGLITYNKDYALGKVGVLGNGTASFTLSGTGLTTSTASGNTEVTLQDYLKTLKILEALDVGDLPVGFLIIPSGYAKFTAAECHTLTRAATRVARKHDLRLLVDIANPKISRQVSAVIGTPYVAPPSHAVGSVFNYLDTSYQVVTALPVTTATNGTTYPVNTLVYVPELVKVFRSLVASAAFAAIANPTEAELLNFVEESPKDLIQRWVNTGGLTVKDRGYTEASAIAEYCNAVPEGVNGEAFVMGNYWDDGTGAFYPASIVVAAYLIKTWLLSGFLVNHAGNRYPIPEIAGLSYEPKTADLEQANSYNYLGAKGNFHLAGVRTNSKDSRFLWLTGAVTTAMVSRKCLIASTAIQYQPLQGVGALLGTVQNVYITVMESLAQLFFDRQYEVIADLTNNTLERLQEGNVNVKICTKLSPNIDKVELTFSVKALNEEF